MQQTSDTPTEIQNTRERILAVCRALFNEAGPAAVTTAAIARAAGINEGNLYYYFRKKEDMLLALFGQFEQALNEVADGLPPPVPGQDPGVTYLRRWFVLMWEWRFFYRDGTSVKRLAPALKVRCLQLSDRGQAAISRALRVMCDDGSLRIPDDELERLVVNAWIVSSYCLDYLCAQRNVDEIQPAHLEWGFAQVLALFAPYRRV